MNCSTDLRENQWARNSLPRDETSLEWYLCPSVFICGKGPDSFFFRQQRDLRLAEEREQIGHVLHRQALFQSVRHQ